MDDTNIQVRNTQRIGSTNALDQLKKCDERIKTGDHDGAISSSRSLLESVFADIYEKTTGEVVKNGGSLTDSYKVLKNTLNLSENKDSNKAIKGLLNGLVTMVASLDSLSNQMGDRHRRPVKPQPHHAQLCVNSAKTLTNFLYDTLEHCFKGRENIYQQLIQVLDSRRIRFLPYDAIMTNPGVQEVYRRTDRNIRNSLKRQFIKQYEIKSYRNSDIFFAALWILRDELTSADVKEIFQMHRRNNQACQGLYNFLTEITRRQFKQNLLTDEMRSFCEKYDDFYSAKEKQ